MLPSPAFSLLDEALAKVNVKLGKLKPSSNPTANDTENAQPPPLLDGKLKNNKPTLKSFFPSLPLPEEVDSQFDSFELGLTQDQSDRMDKQSCLMDSLIETFKDAYFDQVGNLAESDNSDIFEFCYDAVITETALQNGFKGNSKILKKWISFGFPDDVMTPDEVPRIFYAKYFGDQKAIIEQMLLSNEEINEMEKQELKHLCDMIGHFITEFNNQMIWKTQQPLKIFLGNFSMKLISQIKDDSSHILNKGLTQTFLNKDLRKLVLDKDTARKCGILYLQHLVIDKREMQSMEKVDDDMPSSPIFDYVEDKSKIDSAMMSPVSVAPVQTADRDLEIPKMQSLEKVNDDDIPSSPISDYEDKSKVDSAIMSPVSVAPVHTVDLDLKESANEDPVVDSDEDWTKLDDCEEEEIVTKRWDPVLYTPHNERGKANRALFGFDKISIKTVPYLRLHHLNNKIGPHLMTILRQARKMNLDMEGNAFCKELGFSFKCFMEYESSPEKASCEEQFAYLQGLLSISGKVKYEDNVMDQLRTHNFKHWLVQSILAACLNGSIEVKDRFTWLNDEKWIELTEIKHMVAKINDSLGNGSQIESVALKDANLHENDDNKAEIKSENHFDPDALNGFDLDDIPDDDNKAEIKSENHFDPDALKGFDLDDIPDDDTKSDGENQDDDWNSEDDANADGEDRDKAVMSLVKLDDWITMDDADDANEAALSPAQSNEKTVSPFSPVLSKVDNERVEGGVEKVSPPSILPSIGEKVSPFLNESENCLNDENVISQASIEAGDKEPEPKENSGGQLIQRKSSSKSGSVLKIR